MKQNIIEFLPVVLMSTITLIVHFLDINPIHRGFFCDDQTLKYPYIESQTIPTYVCFIIWGVLAIFTIITTQIFSKSFSIKVIKNVILGALCCILLTDITKYVTGKLRPHFLSLCDPDYDNICFDESAYYIDDDGEALLDEFYQKYVIETEVCSMKNSELLREARLSFLSGHASFSFYFAIFIILYTNDYTQHLKWRNNIVPLIQLLVILLAAWISLTRITDFYHHPIDVLFGAFTGISVGFYYNKIENLEKEVSHIEKFTTDEELLTDKHISIKNSDM